jgi:hypothetical protein
MVLVGVLLALHMGALWQLLVHPPTPSGTFPVVWQIAITIGWIILLGYCFIDRRNKSRVIWLICGFILYSAVRLVLFAQTDYDRQRTPFLLVTAGVMAGLMLVIGLTQSPRGYRTKEKLTDDR